jgi:hypothetical protein
LADHRYVSIEREIKRNAVEYPAATVLGERQIGDGEFAGQRSHRARLLEQEPRIDHACGAELLDDLLVGDLGSLEDLIKAEQFIPRRC